MESFLCFIQIMFAVLILHHYHHHVCDATTKSNKNQTYYCPPSSCGEITNIKHPFRLKNDPTTCGDPRYELSCENNKTTLALFSGKYCVKSINYKNYTIRLVDPGIEDGDCSSIPQYFLTTSNFTSYYNNHYHRDPYEVGDQYRLGHIIYLNCSKPVKNDPMYVETSPCVKWNSKGHVYAITGDIKTGSLNVGCQVKLVAMSSASAFKPNLLDNDIRQNYSYLEIHAMLSFGFYVSWIRRGCEDSCDINLQYCYLSQRTGSLECQVDYCETPLGHFMRCGK
ncbi:rust resistance kinase Lr10 [Trifolium repens]|nr:rust resistance kinase Lr10 [Trifolium repens]